MIEIGENYYLINKNEITNDMEPLADGLYKLGENLYEVIGNKEDNSTSSQNSNKKRADTITSSNYSTIFFIFSVLLIALTVLCIYLGITYIVEYGKILNQSNQLGATSEILTKSASDYLRNGIFWILGGMASLILGSILSLIYNSQK